MRLWELACFDLWTALWKPQPLLIGIAENFAPTTERTGDSASTSGLRFSWQ
jgi:hypothetical protein